MAKNGQKVAKNGQKHFFWKKIFCYFFITYQGLTRCRKSKKSNERILRSGGRTNERMNGQRQNYRTKIFFWSPPHPTCAPGAAPPAAPADVEDLRKKI